MKGKTFTTAVAVAIGLAAVGYFFFNNPFATQPTVNQNPQPGSPDQVVVQDVTVGTGAEATPGMKLEVNYIGKLQNGTVFDQSSSHGGPLPFTLGASGTIAGWSQGIQGMKEGGTRIIIIPPSLGYGAQAIGPIPPNSTLIFQVELVKVVGPATTTSSAQ